MALLATFITLPGLASALALDAAAGSSEGGHYLEDAQADGVAVDFFNDDLPPPASSAGAIGVTGASNRAGAEEAAGAKVPSQMALTQGMVNVAGQLHGLRMDQALALSSSTSMSRTASSTAQSGEAQKTDESGMSPRRLFSLFAAGARAAAQNAAGAIIATPSGSGSSSVIASSSPAVISDQQTVAQAEMRSTPTKTGQSTLPSLLEETKKLPAKPKPSPSSLFSPGAAGFLSAVGQHSDTTV